MPARARTVGGASPGLPWGGRSKQSSASRAVPCRSVHPTRTHDESRRAASSHVLTRRETARVLAAAFLGRRVGGLGDGRRGARRGARPPGVAARASAVEPSCGLSPPAAGPSARAGARTSRWCCERCRRAPRMPPRVLREPIFHPEMVRARWPVPRIDTVGDLAAWLALEVGELEWFADVRGLERVVDDERLRHYRYAHLPRKTGPPRVIERPKPRLKALQRRILHELLDWIPVHDAAHGFVRGRSARLARLAAHRPPRGRPARPRGLLRRRDRRARVRDLPHGRLSRVGRAHADRAVHQRRPAGASRSPGTTGSRAVSRRRTFRRARRPRRRWPTSRPSGSTAA